MRTLLPLLALGLLLAGCVDAPQDAATLDPALPPAPFAGEGTVFLPPTQGEDRTETLIPFPVNATGWSLVADLALGSRYGPLDLPPFPSDVQVELRAPDGTVLAEGSLSMQQAQARVEAVSNATGEHTLALLSYGGSDGEANGDHVDWRLEAAPSS